MSTLGETLAGLLEARGVSVVFGIPGVHTVELYRGLAASSLRHVTARHEQGAGFMADGYARVAGRAGVVLVITGPGLANALTAMAQARADSVPMLVISAVNARGTRGAGLGLLHELPDQLALSATVALSAREIGSASELADALDEAFEAHRGARPGPRHVQIPVDVARLPAPDDGGATTLSERPDAAGPDAALDVADRCPDPFRRADFRAIVAGARRRVLVCGGGARFAAAEVRALAERLDAPVVLTANARGLMHGHPLCVPASPSLAAVRELISTADVVIALGTELGATDFDVDGTAPPLAFARLVRVDVCARQLALHPADLTLRADAAHAVRAWLSRDPGGALPGERAGGGPSDDPVHGDGDGDGDGAVRAARARDAAWAGLDASMRRATRVLEAIRDGVPNAIIVGDSTQPVYAGNLYYDHDRPGGWFNAATGFGALGYAIPAAIGASLAAPHAAVVCLIGDGGAQFSLAELMSACDERVGVIFVVWNNRGHLEIELSMRRAGVDVVGCSPSPPRFEDVARACDLPWFGCAATPRALSDTLRRALASVGTAGGRPVGPLVVELDARADDPDATPEEALEQ